MKENIIKKSVFLNFFIMLFAFSFAIIYTLCLDTSMVYASEEITLEAKKTSIDASAFDFTPISGTTNCIVKLVDKTIERALIPRTVEIDSVDYSVTEVAVNGFSSSVNLKSVTLPTTVKKIGNTAFQNCPNLEIVYFPEVTDIGMNAFSLCPKLTDVILPISVEKVGATIFRNNNTAVHVRAEVQPAGWNSNWNRSNANAFVEYNSGYRHEMQYEDTEIASFSDANETVTMRTILAGQPLSEEIYAYEPIIISASENTRFFYTIQTDAFYDCRFSDFIVEADDTPIRIESYAFEYCEGNSLSIYRNIIFEDENTDSQSMYIMNECQIPVINLPNTIDTIVEGMFYYNRALKNVNFIELETGEISPSLSGRINLPSNILEIKDYAFAGTNFIDYLSILSCTSMGNEVFYDWNANQVIHVPFSSDIEMDSMWGTSWKNGSNAEIEYDSIITYHVSYNKNRPNNASDIVNGTIPNSSHIYGENKSLTKNNYSLKGWTFTGWNTAADGSGVWFNDEEIVRNLTTTNDSMVNLYAQWVPNTYTVKYDSNVPLLASDSIDYVMENTTHIYDVFSHLRVNAYTLIGWTFIGWNTAADGSGESYGNNVEVGTLMSLNDESITLYAQWTANSYTVIYNSNRPNTATGAIIGEMDDSVHMFDTPSLLSKNNYTLLGWYFTEWNTSINGSGRSLNDMQSISDLVSSQNGEIVLFAQWREKTYSISYEKNKPTETEHSVNGTMEKSYHRYDVSSRLMKNAYSLTGWEFLGWSLSKNGPVEYLDEAIVLNLSIVSGDNVPLYAIWTPITYSISYKENKPGNASNQVTGIMEDSNHLYDHSSNLSFNCYNLVGWEFVGWNTKADGNGTNYTDHHSIRNLSELTGGIIELYAQWEAKTYIVSLNPENEEENITILVTFDSPMPATNIPYYHNDYEFIGYYASINSTEVMYYNSDAENVKKWNIDEDYTLTAKYERVYFYVSFNQTGGIGEGGTTQIRIKYGESWPQITMPTRKGYIPTGYYYSIEIENYKIYNSDGSFNANNIVFSQNFYSKRDISLHCSWNVANYYYFTIEKYHSRADEATQMAIYSLPYDDSIDYTVDERMTWTQYSADGQNIIASESRAFTKWVMNLNGPSDFDAVTNPWHIISTDRHLVIDVAEIIEEYYPNYTDKSLLDNIHIRAIYADDSQNIVPSCVAEGTMITLADGSQKAVESLTGDELLLVWNLMTGEFDVAPILFVDKDPAKMYEIINLYFSDGTTVKVISEHGFWDCDLNKYVYLRADASKYIGHWFNKQAIDSTGQLTWGYVQLVNVVVQNEYTTAWSPVTAEHLCYYVNGMLSMPGGISGLFNIFEIDQTTMKVDYQLFLADIEEYGLYTYDEFVQIFPISQMAFESLGGRYLKISIGKGLIDLETIAKLIQRYAQYLEI